MKSGWISNQRDAPTGALHVHAAGWGTYGARRLPSVHKYIAWNALSPSASFCSWHPLIPVCAKFEQKTVLGKDRLQTFLLL
jgi:hypothetical protein